MHKTAEYGTAHWKYKEGVWWWKLQIFDDKLTWLRQLMDLADVNDNREFVASFKEDLFQMKYLCFHLKRDKLIWFQEQLLLILHIKSILL